MARPSFSAYIGLGANIDEPMRQLSTAVHALHQHPEIEVVRCSQVYVSAAYGVTDQNDFHNAVIEVSTQLSAIGLLHALLAQEQTQGRIRERRWGPRCIDLDLLSYENAVWCSNTLMLPHPEIALRRFVLLPLRDVAPQFELLGQSLDQLIAHCEPQEITVAEHLTLSPNRF